MAEPKPATFLATLTAAGALLACPILVWITQGVATVRYLSPQERDVVRRACESPQERLIVALTMLVGLRHSEAVHLTWGNYIRDVEPVE